jgi:hypothetical protein
MRRFMPLLCFADSIWLNQVLSRWQYSAGRRA